MISKLLFAVGIVMIAYDCLCHLAVALAFRFVWPNYFWNSYSTYIWPTFKSHTLPYHVFWSAFFVTAIAFLIAGYMTK